MAEKLSITIALNGAEEIKRQLADVGQAGKDCFNDINKAAADVGGFNKLDPSVVTAKLVQTGVAGKDVAKVLTAVNQAGRMETLVNGLAAVENGLVKVQAAASSMDAVLLKGLTRSIGMIARLLPAAFGAATVGAIVNSTKEIRRLDEAAIKAGISIEDMAKAEAIFKAIGLSSKSAAEGVAAFVGQLEKINAANVKAAADAVDEFGRSTRIIVEGKSVDALQFLIDHLNDAGEAGEIARKKLQEIGKIQISDAARQIDEINQSAASTPDKMLAIIGVLEKMGPTAERTRIANRLFGPEFVQALNAGGVQLDLIRFKLASMPVPTQAAANAAARLALEWEKLKAQLTPGITVEGLDQLATVLETIRATCAAIAATDTFQGMSNILNNTIRDAQGLINILALIGETGFKAFKYIEAGAVATWQTIIGWIEKAIEKVKSFFSLGGGQATAGADAGGFARGGLMGGRGSGTSDSNLAWLSRGEHVMPARAVRQPGVLSLLEALRRSGGNMRSVLDRMGHFAQGGIVGGGMSHVTIAFPGMSPISGLRAPGSVVDELRRAAGMAQVRSGGRKPSRYF